MNGDTDESTRVAADVSSFWRYWAKSGTAPGEYHAVPAHLLDSAAVLATFVEGNPKLRADWAAALRMDPERIVPFFSWWQGIHDLGKFCDRFQACHESLFQVLHPNRPRRQNSPHHTTTAQIVLVQRILPMIARRWAENGSWSERDWRRVLNTCAPAFTGHHGEPPEALPLRVEDVWDSEGLRVATRWCDALAELLNFEPPFEPGADAKDVAQRVRAASWHFAGLAVLCDWIASQESEFRVRSDPPDSLAAYWQKDALPQAREAVARAGVLPVSAAPAMPAQALVGFEPSPVQAFLDQWSPDAGPNLLIVEDLTGSGKTEACLLAINRAMAAGEADGFYFALPTQATANAIYSRMQRSAVQLYRDPSAASLVLAHSGRLALKDFKARTLQDARVRTSHAMEDEGRLACAAWLADNRKRAFLAHAGVGTIDQALLGVLPVRHQALRLFGLTSKVLVVDEVHAYDAHATQLLQELISFQARAGGTTILLSATMPLALRTRFVRAFAESCGRGDRLPTSGAYPLVTVASEGGLKEVPLSHRPHTERAVEVHFVHDGSAVERLVRDAAKEGNAVCWIRNTVEEASAAARALGDIGAELLHARFTEADRRRRENKLLEWAGPAGTPDARAGRVVVATQVVEQSLDIDFDVLVTDLAPVELILQRAGRLHRHSGRTRACGTTPVLHVHAPPYDEDPGADVVREWSPGTNAVYQDVGRLWLTYRALRKERRIVLPDRARALIENVYGPDCESEIPRALRDSTHDATADAAAKRSHASMKALPLDQGYSARAGPWLDPDRGRTRAGENAIEVYLAHMEDGRLRPLASATDGWDGARLSVRENLARTLSFVAHEGTLNQLPAHVRRARVLVLEDAGRGTWSARQPADHGGAQIIQYDDRLGFRVTREKGDSG